MSGGGAARAQRLFACGLELLSRVEVLTGHLLKIAAQGP